MKKIILLFAICLLQTNLKAQTNVYHPFPDSNAIWIEEWTKHMDTSVHYISRTSLIGDTVINAVNYNKLYSSFVHNDPYLGFDSSWKYTGGIREDITKKIYFLDSDSINEMLIYDFSKNIGDTIPSSKNFAPLIIENIDSILINNQYRKRFLLDSLGYSFIIEGIGYNGGLFGLFTTAWIFSWTLPDLVCFIQGGNILYHNPNYNSCFRVITTIDDKEYKHAFKLIPNPSNGLVKLEIENTTNETLKIEIINVSGQQVYRKQYSNTIHKQIDLSGLPKGIYFVKMQGKDLINVQKLVLQ